MGAPRSPVTATFSPSDSLGDLFHVNFFPPLVCGKLQDKEIVRLSSCDRSLKQVLAREVHEIHEKARNQRVADWLYRKDTRVDSLQFLLCLSYALVRSLAHGNMLPFDRFIGSMAFGSQGFHANSVGFDSVHDIFDTDGEEDDEAPWFY